MDAKPSAGVDDGRDEGVGVTRLVEAGLLAVAAVEDVVPDAANGGSGSSRQATTVRDAPLAVDIRYSPFSRLGPSRHPIRRALSTSGRPAGAHFPPPEQEQARTMSTQPPGLACQRVSVVGSERALRQVRLLPERLRLKSQVRPAVCATTRTQSSPSRRRMPPRPCTAREPRL